MDYFIVFGSIGILFLISLAIIFKLMYQMSDLTYELKLGKINCQKDLDRLEDRINQLANRSNEGYRREIDELQRLHDKLSKLVDDKEMEIKSAKKLLND
jgi:peptidoglycan hydrolase CwlO-like protein